MMFRVPRQLRLLSTQAASRKWQFRTGPAVAHLASQYHLNLEKLIGTGPNGIVTKGDVLAALARNSTVPSPSTPSTPTIAINTPSSTLSTATRLSLPKHTILQFPALSPTMVTGTLAKWMVKEGSKVKAGDVIADIETDKASVSLEAQDDAIIGKRLVGEGTQNIPVNAPIAVLLENETDVGAFKSVDIRLFLDGPSGNSTQAAAPSPTNVLKKSTASPEILLKTVVPSNTTKTPMPGVVDTNLTRSDSKKTIPHYYILFEVCLDNLMATSKRLFSKMDKSSIVVDDVTNALILRAASQSLIDVSVVNTRWTGQDSIRSFSSSSIAAHFPCGNSIHIQQAQTLGLVQLVNKLKEHNNASADLYATIALFFPVWRTNIKGTGSFSREIVHPRHSVSLSLSDPKIYVSSAVGNDGKLVLKNSIQTTATLSCDHRLVDGAVAAKWASSFKTFVETPYSSLL